MKPPSKPFLIDKRQVYEAYLEVRSKEGAGGVDGVTIEQFEKDLKGNLYKIWNRMSSGAYFAPPVRAVAILKKNGGQRILGVPTVADRVVQTVVKQMIEPDLDKIFLEDSYGYRPDKSALDAVGVTRERCWKYDWVLEFDIKGLFDNIDHGRGEIAFGALQAGLDIEYSRSSLGFTWEGFDEMDDVSGDVSAELLDDGTIEIEFAYRNGGEAVLKAKRDTSCLLAEIVRANILTRFHSRQGYPRTHSQSCLFSSSRNILDPPAHAIQCVAPNFRCAILGVVNAGSTERGANVRRF